MAQIIFANRTEWRYIYNNSSAREQKRMYYNPAGITGNNLYPWQYTLLDAGNKESVLYAGFVNADQLLACTDGTNYVNSDSAVLQSWVTPPQYTKQSLYIAPVEFYANGLMSWKVDANNQWQRSYKVLDHLGNVRVEGIGWANEYRADYRPFGGTEWTNSNINSKKSYRLGFLGLQKDKESNLGDHGVRKYDSEIGRFLAIDPLWEKYNTLNPYQYSGNSPVMMVDVNGLEFGFSNAEIEGLYNQFYNSLGNEDKTIFDQMREDKNQKYWFGFDASINGGGLTTYNTKENRLDMLVNPRNANKDESMLGALADEATTGKQFATGKLFYFMNSGEINVGAVAPFTLEMLESETKMAYRDALSFYNMVLPEKILNFNDACNSNRYLDHYYLGMRYADPSNISSFFNLNLDRATINLLSNQTSVFIK